MSSIYSEHKPGNTSDLYLRLKDGDTVKLRIHSAPAIVLFKEDQRPRYSWVVINHTNGKAQVFNAGISIYNQIADLVEEWGDPTEFDITIKRKGSGQFDTEYSVTPTRTPTAPTKAQEEEADKIDLINASKGKWLDDYNRDGILPDPIITQEPQTGYNKAREQADKLKKDELSDNIDETLEEPPIDLSDIPF